MEERVAKLEADVGDIKATLGRLEPMLTRMDARFTEFGKELGKMREDMARLDGRVSELPTTWTLLVGVVSIIGVVFGFLRFGMK